jgi:hypothetical protein
MLIEGRRGRGGREEEEGGILKAFPKGRLSPQLRYPRIPVLLGDEGIGDWEERSLVKPLDIRKKPLLE